MYEMKFFAEDHVGIFIVHVEIQRELAEPFRKQRNEVVDVGYFPFRRHEREYEFPADLPRHDMPQRARLFLLVVALYRTFRRITFDDGYQFFRPVGVNGASVDGYDPMTAFGVKADHGVPLFIHAYGHLQFITVAVRQIAFDRRGHVYDDTAYLPQRVLDHRRLMYELRLVFEMLQTATAATQKHGTFRPRAFLGGRKHFFDLTVTDVTLTFKDFEPYLFSG